MTSYSWGPQRYGVTLEINPERMPEIYPDDVISWDFETDEKEFKPCGLGVYIPRLKYAAYITDFSKRYLGTVLQTPKMVGHHADFDMHRAREIEYEIPLENIIFDTKLDEYVHDNTSVHKDLKDLAETYFHRVRPHYRDITQPGGKKTRITSMDKQPLELAAAYCAMDCIDTYDLYERAKKVRTQHERWYFDNLEFPLMKVLYKMEKKGVAVNSSYLTGLSSYFEGRLSEINSDLVSVAGREFNPRSPKQKVEVLQSLGLDVDASNKKALDPYLGEPFVQKLLEFNHIATLNSSFAKKLPRLSEESEDGRVHTSYNQIAFTGRLTSSGPNLQNIPTNGIEGNKVRIGFVPSPHHKWLVADASQIEMRFAAHFFRENKWMEAFHSGQDIHEATAELMGCGRREGKTVNYAKMFGAGVGQIAYQAKCSWERAQELNDLFTTKAEGFNGGKAQLEKYAYDNGFIKTLYGRKIFTPGIRSKDWEVSGHAQRQCLSGLVQGSAAEYFKRCAIEVDRLGLTPVLGVHDELDFEIPENEVNDARAAVHNVMTKCVEISVPIEVDIAVGDNWGCKS